MSGGRWSRRLDDVGGGAVDMADEVKLIGNDMRAGTGGSGAGVIFLQEFVTAESGIATEFRMYSRAVGNVKVAIYSKLSNMIATLLSGVSDPVAVTVGVNQIPISPTPLMADETYSLVAIADQNLLARYTSAPTTCYYSYRLFNGYAWEQSLAFSEESTFDRDFIYAAWGPLASGGAGRLIGVGDPSMITVGHPKLISAGLSPGMIRGS